MAILHELIVGTSPEALSLPARVHVPFGTEYNELNAVTFEGKLVGPVPAGPASAAKVPVYGEAPEERGVTEAELNIVLLKPAPLTVRLKRFNILPFGALTFNCKSLRKAPVFIVTFTVTLILVIVAPAGIPATDTLFDEPAAFASGTTKFIVPDAAEPVPATGTVPPVTVSNTLPPEQIVAEDGVTTGVVGGALTVIATLPDIAVGPAQILPVPIALTVYVPAPVWRPKEMAPPVPDTGEPIFTLFNCS
jgi:hypothetical protein